MEPRAVVSADEMQWALTRMTHEILEKNHGSDDVILLGIITRGAPLAERIGAIAKEQGHEIPVGQLDITMYRDDLRRNPTRMPSPTVLPAEIDDKVVVLVDDVLFSGRTVQADVTGKHIPTARDERVRVQLTETDGEDLITIERSGQ